MTTASIEICREPARFGLTGFSGSWCDDVRRDYDLEDFLGCLDAPSYIARGGMRGTMNRCDSIPGFVPFYYISTTVGRP